MISNENNNKITDQAWNNLYKRLGQDGLLSEEKPRRGLTLSIGVRWAASVAVICICITVVIVMMDRGAQVADMLTLHNGEDTPTLVSTLEDGSVVYLSERASLKYPDHFQEDKRVVELEGEAYFEINKNRQRPFIIETERAIVEVLGTAFSVNSRKNSAFYLSVRSGEVKVISKKDGQTVFVKAGEATLLESDRLQKLESKRSEFNKYMEQIHFKDEKLVDIVRVINMNSDSVSLKIAPNLENRLLTVSFLGNSPQNMADLICIALNLQHIRKENVITISEQGK